MSIVKFESGGKNCYLYTADVKNAPLILLISNDEDGKLYYYETSKICVKPFNLLNICGIDWNNDLTPWECSPIFKGGENYLGKADDFITLIVSDIIPNARESVLGEPSYIGIAGYSLAGIFAIYSLYKCDIFDVVASMSGSLWFPGFKNFIKNNCVKKMPRKIYISLGDAEAKTRNQILKSVYEDTIDTVDFYKKRGVNVEWELNPGNHFTNVQQRIIKGITSILE